MAASLRGIARVRGFPTDLGGRIGHHLRCWDGRSRLADDVWIQLVSLSLANLAFRSVGPFYRTRTPTIGSFGWTTHYRADPGRVARRPATLDALARSSGSGCGRRPGGPRGTACRPE